MDRVVRRRQQDVGGSPERRRRPSQAAPRSPSGTSGRGKRPSGPVQFFALLLKTWRLDRPAAAALLGFEPAEPGRVDRLLQGQETLAGRDARDRIAHLFEVRKTLAGLFRSEDVENAWLREPHAGLGQRSPMELLREGTMENLLVVRDHVLTVAGRRVV